MTADVRERHRLLERQIRKTRDATGAIDLDRLLDLVSDAYVEQDDARRLNDHAVRLMSDELQALNVRVRSEAAAEARAAETHLYALLESVADGVIVLDEEDRVVAFNAAAEAMFGRPRAEVTGKHFLELGLTDEPELANFLLGPIRESFAEIQARRNGGELFAAEVATARMNLDRRRRTLTLWRNITARKAAEDTLRIARDEARAANQAKSEFLAAMSHEIRTPLNGILGVASALSQTHLAGRQAEMVRVIMDSGELLTVILSDILDLAKIEAGRLEVEQASFEAQPLLAGAASLFEPTAAAKGLQLVTDFGPGMQTRLVGDAARLRQVVQNLISNAVKFTAAGTVMLKAWMEPAEGRRLLVRVEVWDTGCGVPEAARERLFTRFSQADSSTTRRYGGTGLGLALCRELVGAMGGEIGMRPNPDGGACFWFAVPLATAESEEPAFTSQVQDESLSLQGLRVLAVDDNATNRFVLQTILDAAGCVTTLAEDGRQAVQLVGECAFDVILMDVHMPVLDGLGAAREIRRLGGEHARTPIIAVTAEAMPEQIARARDAGMDGHVIKPIRPHNLLMALATAMDARNTSRVLAAAR